MASFILRRAMAIFFALIVVCTIIFFMFRLMPGDPTAAMVDPSIPSETREHIIERLGLNDSLWVQYIKFMKNLALLDFGDSFYYKVSALTLLKDKLAATLILMFSSMIVAYGLGVLGGAWVAWNRGTIRESLLVTVSLIFRSAPTFLLGIIAIYIFTVLLGWLPHSGIRSPGHETDGFFQTYISLDFLRHLILPTIVAGMYIFATPLLVMRNTMLEIMGEDFIEMVRAKGLREQTILYKHAARNALLPVVTAGALFIGSAIGGQVLIEYVFSWPGLGREMVLAAQRRDYPVAQASFIIMATLIMIMNLVADILYAYLDPRISYK